MIRTSTTGVHDMMTPAAFLAFGLLSVAAVGVAVLALSMADRRMTPALLGVAGFVAVLAALI
jgi:hypothetical protein